MERGLFDITSTGETTLIPIYSRAGSIKSISICNYDSLAASVSVYLEDASSTKSYIIYDVKIGSKVTLVLDDVSFDNSVLALKMNVSTASPSLSVIIK